MIYIVGIGPGGLENMTGTAIGAIRNSQVIVGYDLYVKLLGSLADGKELISTGMKKEVDRCQKAIDVAKEGKKVAVVCSGDAGVYGMAGIVHELAEGSNLEIKVISGVTAACSGAAVLGAPLIHDFAVISLSDLLTPWEKIEKRLDLAGEADFVICLYNPQSMKRSDYVERAVSKIIKHRSGKTPCGYVKNIGREGEVYKLCTLEELPNENIDMFTTVYIGNSQTKIIDGKLVTPRGYEKYYG
ncbi:MAG: precorrin-3B C(17)-methyltransferase [Filifactoraceae bacterium]